MDDPFQYRRRVAFAETDLAGMVHFSCFFRYMEEAEHALWRAAGLLIDRAGSDLGWPRVSASFDFRRPLRFDDECAIEVQIAGTSRRTIRYRFIVTRDGDEIGTGTIVAACARRTPQGHIEAVDVPAGIVERLEAAGARIVADES